MQLLLFCIILIYAKYSFAEEAPVCTSKSISRNCEFFKEHQNESEIKLEDGTLLKNPMYNSALAENKKMDSDTNGYGDAYPTYDGKTDFSKIHEQALAEQSEVLELLEGSNLPMRSKLFLSTNGAMLFGSSKINFLFPLSESKADLKEVESNRVLEELKKTLPDDKFSKLVRLWEEKSARIRAEYEKSNRDYLKTVERLQKTNEEKTEKAVTNNKRIQSLFDYAKLQVMNAIKNGIPDSKLNSEQIKMIEKVKTVELQSDDWISNKCAANPNNASSNPVYNTIVLCAGARKMSNSNLVFTLAHEITHAIDPCGFQMEIWEVDRERLQKFMSQNDINLLDKAMLEEILKSKNKYINVNLDMIISDTKLINKLEKSKAFAKLHEASSLDKYPFQKAYKCQVEQNNFRERNEADIEISKHYIRKDDFISLGQSENEKKLIENSVGRYLEEVKKYSQCYDGATHKSQLGEVIADSVSAYALEAYFKDKPNISEGEKVSAIPFGHSECNNEDESKYKNIESVAPLIYQVILKKNINEHPMSEQRIEKIVLSRPFLAHIYGCRSARINCFYNLSNGLEEAENNRGRGVK